MNPIKLLQNLLQIESVTGNEQSIMEYIVALLNEIGLTIIIQHVDEKRYNIISYPKYCDPKNIRLMFSGHVDTVPIGTNWSHKQGEIIDNKIYGRGSVDMKGGIASLICAISNNIKSKLNFLLVLTIGEETNMIGAKTFIQSCRSMFPNLQNFIVCEPTTLKLLYMHKGGIAMEIVAHGKAVHASMPELGENAIYKIMDVINDLRKYRENVYVENNILTKPTINVGMIQGGVATNQVPDKCTTRIETRIVPPEYISRVETEIEKIISNYKNVELNVLARIPPFSIPRKDPFLMNIMQILDASDNDLFGVSYCTEASFYSEFGLNGIVLGPGDQSLCHVVDEYIEIDQLIKAMDIYSKIMLELN
jgi:succinyl-diaminopimelate desuccinylase